MQKNSQKHTHNHDCISQAAYKLIVWCVYNTDTYTIFLVVLFFYILHTGCAINLAPPAIIMYRSDEACGAPPRTYNYCVARCTKKFDKICILSTFLGKLAKKELILKEQSS